jgi:hypothetical protein
MTLTADDKGRLTCSQLFPAGTRFDARTDDSGRIVLTKLVKQENEAKLVRMVEVNGMLMMPPSDYDMDALVRQIHEEREAQ